MATTTSKSKTRLGASGPRPPGDRAPAPRLSLRDAQKRLTRDRLLDAAYAVFTQVGYRQATIDQITAHAGANRATFYLHFKDKVEVAAALGRRIAGGFAHAFLRLDEIENPSPKNIRAWLEGYIGETSRDRMLTEMLNEAISAEAEFGQEYMLYISGVADRMTNHLSRFSGKRREIARSKIVLVQLLLARHQAHMFVQGLPFPGKHEIDALAESVWTMLFDGANLGSVSTTTKAKKPPAR